MSVADIVKDQAQGEDMIEPYCVFSKRFLLGRGASDDFVVRGDNEGIS